MFKLFLGAFGLDASVGRFFGLGWRVYGADSERRGGSICIVDYSPAVVLVGDDVDGVIIEGGGIAITNILGEIVLIRQHTEYEYYIICPHLRHLSVHLAIFFH